MPKIHLDIGTGHRARFAAHIAKIHPGYTEVYGLDELEIDKKAARELVDEKTAERLKLKPNANVIRFLKGRDNNSIDSASAHFVLNNMTYADREALYKHMANALVPGGTFNILMKAPHHRQIPTEIEHHTGLKVESRRMTPEELLHIQSDSAQAHASQSISEREGMQRLSKNPGLLKKSYAFLIGDDYLSSLGMSGEQIQGFRSRVLPGASSFEDYKNTATEVARTLFRIQISAFEGSDISRGAKDSIKLIVDDMHHMYSEKPFVSFTVTKPK